MALRTVRAMTAKEFRQLRRDRRTMALLFFQPLIMLVVFGYAASFDVTQVPTALYGPAADALGERLPEVLDVRRISAEGDRDDAVAALRSGDITVAMVTAGSGATATINALVDGSQLFAARNVVTGLARSPMVVEPEILFNPGLDTPPVLVPALAGLVLAFVGTIATSLGVVRERQTGTMEQLAVMPFRASDVLAGKLLPYLMVALLDLGLVVAAAVTVFGVPFNGSPLVFLAGSLIFLLTTLGLGLLISTVSENQGQAMQLALLVLLPQILLSGMIFPLEAMADVLRYTAYALPLTWFVELSQGVMLRAAGWTDLAVPMLAMTLQALAVLGLSIARVRRDLLPASRTRPRHGRRGSLARVRP